MTYLTICPSDLSLPEHFLPAVTITKATKPQLKAIVMLFVDLL